MPDSVINYLKDQLLRRKKPVRKAIQNSYNYWKAMYEFTEEGLSEDEARSLLGIEALQIKGELSVED